MRIAFKGQKELNRLKSDLKEAETMLQKAHADDTTAQGVLNQHCIDRAKQIKDTLRSSGSNQYNNYNKSDYRECANKIVQAGYTITCRLDDSKRQALLALHQAQPKPKIHEVVYQLPSLSTLAKKVSQLLGTTVLSAAIQSLKDDHELSSWVHQGLRLTPVPRYRPMSLLCPSFTKGPCATPQRPLQ